MHWALQQFQKFGDKTACHEADKRWSFHQLITAVEALNDSLRAARIQTHSVVSIETDKSFECLIALLACQQNQLVAVPLSHELGEAERITARQVAAVQWRIGSGYALTQLQHTDEPTDLIKTLENRQHSGLILFSSGTSGAPKAMLHDFDALLQRYSKVKPRQDRSLLLMHLDHIGGIDAALRTLLAGSALIIPESRTPESAAQAIETYKVNILPCTPTFLNLLLLSQQYQKHDLSSVEIIAYGAEAMPPALLERLVQQFPKAEFQQKFGTSETGAIRIQSTNTNSLFFRIQDPDTEWRIHEGELWLKTPSRILGYLNADQSALEANGWYRTGDLVEKGADDSLRIIGRASELINVGGEKVTPGEVEAIVLQIPQIESCIVFSEANAITGQSVAIKVFASAGSSTSELKRKIKRHCRQTLAAHKVPTRIYFTDHISISSRHKRLN